MTGATRDEGAVAAEAVPGAGTGNTPSFVRFPSHNIRVVAHVCKSTWSRCRQLEELLVGLIRSVSFTRFVGLVDLYAVGRSKFFCDDFVSRKYMPWLRRGCWVVWYFFFAPLMVC